MIAYLSLIRAPLPDVAARGLAVARQFQDGAVGPDQLVEARVSCWKYLDERKATTDFKTPEHCAIRAVIFLLYDRPEPGEGVGDAIDLFLRLANKYEDHSNLAGLLLKQSFSSSQLA